MIVRNISPKIVYKSILKKEEVILLDVRTKEEFEESRISESINLPVDQVVRKVTKVFLNKKAKFYIYCHSGIRSLVAAKEMERQGYKNVFNMTGGIEEWERLKLGGLDKTTLL